MSISGLAKEPRYRCRGDIIGAPVWPVTDGATFGQLDRRRLLSLGHA